MIKEKFQFQYGAIKRINARFGKCGVGIFQFQYGAIKSGLQAAAVGVMAIFQFQYGAIKSVNFEGNTLIENDISIPIWCD